MANMRNRIQFERPDGREFRMTSYTVRRKDVGSLEAAMWNPDRQDWELQELSREDVQALRNYLTAWLGEDD